MKTTSTILAALLGVQLLVAAGLWYSNYSKRTVRPEGQFVEIDDTAITRVTLSDSEENSVVLSKQDDSWIIGESGNLPVDQNKLESLLASMTELPIGWPVATRSNSHDQLEVAEDNHQRRVKLFAGDKQQADFYVGSSPGMRRVHARNVDADDVHSIPLNAYDMPATGSEWLDKTLLSLDDLSRIANSSGELSKDGEEWKLQLGDNSGTADAAKADNIVDALQTLRVLDIAEAVPEDAESVEMVVTGAAGDLTYKFLKQDVNHFVERSDFGAVFGISETAFNNIAGVALSDLVAVEPDASVATEQPTGTAVQPSTETAETGQPTESDKAPAAQPEQ